MFAILFGVGFAIQLLEVGGGWLRRAVKWWVCPAEQRL